MNWILHSYTTNVLQKTPGLHFCNRIRSDQFDGEKFLIFLSKKKKTIGKHSTSKLSFFLIGSTTIALTKENSQISSIIST